MCGIAGVFLRKGVANSGLLEPVVATLAHRGPNDHGIWTEGAIGLVHTRLSIIDITGGHQPLTWGDGRLVLVANGEIYNYVELRKALEKKGHQFATHSDCETLLHAYREYGDDFLQYINGMFAFALWDAQRRRLLLARDRLGIKPLFIRARGDGLAFGSELKALRPLAGEPDVDPGGLAEYLAHQFSGSRRTLWADTERVLPGELVVVEEGRVSARRRYWDARNVEVRERAFDSAAEEFDEVFAQVMREHLRSDVPIGLFLSGGVDSGTLLGELSRLQSKPMQAFSVGFADDSLTDELPLADSVAARFGVQLSPIRPTFDELLEAFPQTVWAADELMRDFASLPTLILARHAASHCKVVFSGEGGDEVFAGYRRYRQNGFERLGKMLLHPGSGGFRTSETIGRGHVRQLYGSELRSASRDSRQCFVDAWQSTPAHWSDLQRRQYVDLVTALPDNLLVKADRMLMRYGVEGRVPFTDHRVVEFGLSLPDHLKVRDGQGKWFLKQWAARFLDRDYLFAPKRGFHVPFRSRFPVAELNRLVGLVPAQPGVRRWFRADAVRTMMKRDADRGQLSSEAFTILQFALWHQMFVEGNGGAPRAGSGVTELLAGGP